MKYRNTIKRITAIMLCMLIALTGLNAQTVSAANKKVPLKVTYDGKTATLVKDLNGNIPNNIVSVKTLKSKWGDPTEEFIDYQDENGKDVTKYYWYTEKTLIEADNCAARKGSVKHFYFGTTAKNDGVGGIKVGMKRNTATKKLKALMKNKGKVLEKTNHNLLMILYTDNSSIEIGFSTKNGKVEEVSLIIN